MKTSELTGAALDWAVAKALDIQKKPLDWTPFPYSTDWAHGGPIIAASWKEISAVALRWVLQEEYEPDPDILVFWMRCFVASRLGDKIEIPKELA